MSKSKIKKGELSNNFIALGKPAKNEQATISPISMPQTATQTTFTASTTTTTIMTTTSSAKSIANNDTISSLKSQSLKLSSTILASSNSTSIDPKTLREELEKSLEQTKENGIDRLNKLILQIINAIKLNFNKQIDLNYILALSYAVTKRASFFLEKPQIIEMLTKFLFTTKLDNQLNSNMSKVKPLSLLGQQTAATSIVQSNSVLVQQLICNLLYKLFENENKWPDMFIKAFIDDSLSERNWIDSEMCKEFVQNIILAFHTKIIPFSFENLSEEMTNQNSNSSSSHQNLYKYDHLNNQQQTKFFSHDMDSLIVETIKEQMSKRTMYENKNLLKLLQITCGIPEIRALSISKLEAWLANPKLHIHAQDLLLAICVNSFRNDQCDREIISQIIKFKPKVKHHQHYIDCIRELAKLNTETFENVLQVAVLNEFTQLRSPHNISIIHTLFNLNGRLATTLFSQMFHKILLTKEDNLRTLRSLLRETIKHSRQDFDMNKFTFELLEDIRKRYADFMSYDQSIRERYVVSICDLITVCIFVSINQQVKDAYSKRNTNESKEVLLRYYQTMASIQSETVTWLQTIVRYYEIAHKERINCLYKVLFMNDKIEIYYNIDNWPPEHERASIFRVVAEMPVLYETLYQVLLISDTLGPQHVLDLEEKLLKTSALNQYKDNASVFKITNLEQYLNALFNLVTYPRDYTNIMLPKGFKPGSLAIGAYYWKTIQILLILTALDPKGFGLIAWENYPTLRLLMEIIMTDDYNFPPQSSLTNDLTIDKFRAIENQIIAVERKEILEFDSFVSKVPVNETNSQLIGKLIKFDPKGPARAPSNEVLQNIRKMNNEYKLGQLLCRSRDPDYLLMLIKRQNATISLSWLSGLIESSIDCLDIMPIQCICEFVWNILSGSEDVSIKKPTNFDQLFKRIQNVLLNDDENDIQMISDTFSYFMNRLCSDKVNVRRAVLKILNKIFLNDDKEINIKNIFREIKMLKNFQKCFKKILLEYLRKAIFYELEFIYTIEYIHFLCEHSLDNQKIELNETANDLNNFITKRKNLRELIFDSNDKFKEENVDFFNFLLDFVYLVIKANEYENTAENEIQIETLKTVKYIKNSESNSQILFFNKQTQKFVYINENIYNLCIYLTIKSSFVDISSEKKCKELVKLLFQEFTIEFLNCGSLKMVLTDLNKYELLHCNKNLSEIYVNYINKELDFDETLKSLHSYYGLPSYIVELLLYKIDFNEENTSLNDFNNICFTLKLKPNILIEILKLYAEEVGYDFKASNKYLCYLFASNEEGATNKDIKTFYLNTNDEGEMDVDCESVVSTDLMQQEEEQSVEVTQINEQNTLCDSILKLFEQKQHEQLIIKTKNLKLNSEQTSNAQLISQLNQLTLIPSNLQTLNEKLVYLVDLLYELICQSSKNNVESLIRNFFFFTNNPFVNTERISIIIKFLLKYECKFEQNVSLIEMFIDLYVKLDKQIITKQLDTEKDELVFGKRYLFSSSDKTTTTKLQTFMILILTHQANWTILNDCVHRLLDRNKTKFLKLNSKIALDFLWSLIHIPTLWRGMESVSNLDLYKEESILDLNENELYCLTDLICDEILNESGNQLKYLFKKRIQLLHHFMSNKNKKCLIEKLSYYLQLNIVDFINNDIFNFNDFNEASKVNLISIRNLILYHLYLDEPTIIYNIRNPSNRFSNLYLEIETPSKIDIKAHSLLSCFNEVDPVKKYDSSSKKQESLIIDANFVCLKLASMHPFIFVRYIPIMEGLLQGRVIYTFDEFKRRKLDKLFHYIIDLLNILVPCLFLKQYFTHLESIISHYFDVFKNYSLDNQELGSLLNKFMDFLERFISNDIQKSLSILNKYSLLISFLQKNYFEISSLKTINSILLTKTWSTLSKMEIEYANLNIPKAASRISSPKQLEPFINKLLNRDNFDGVISVLQELEKCSQLQPFILNEFVHYLHDFLKDSNDVIREITYSLVMRFLRLNPKDSYAFLDVYCQCLNHENTKIFQSAVKVFSDFTLLCSEKSKYLIEYAIRGGTSHNVDVTKVVADALRLMDLEKFLRGCSDRLVHETISA